MYVFSCGKKPRDFRRLTQKSCVNLCKVEFANPKSRVVGSLWWARGTCATDRADGVSRVDVCSSRAAQSSVIVFVVDEIVTYVSVQLDISSSKITAYQDLRRTIVNHQQELRLYLGVRRFGEAELGAIEAYLFDDACRLEQTGPLLNKAKRFLDDQSILFPSDEVLRRLVVKQRHAARDHIYERISQVLVQSTI